MRTPKKKEPVKRRRPTKSSVVKRSEEALPKVEPLESAPASAAQGEQAAVGRETEGTAREKVALPLFPEEESRGLPIDAEEAPVVEPVPDTPSAFVSATDAASRPALEQEPSPPDVVEPGGASWTEAPPAEAAASQDERPWAPGPGPGPGSASRPVPAFATPEPPPALSIPEPGFAARVEPPPPPRPLPSARRIVFFDVENASRAEHIAAVFAQLALDWGGTATELVAVGNWRVIGSDTARLLASKGAHLVHSAPAAGVRDWSDLRIAVSAGVWLASARHGDLLEIITDDQAFDAVGDVASSLGVSFRRVSYMALLGLTPAALADPLRTPRDGRRRRGGRGSRGGRGRREDAPLPRMSPMLREAPQPREGPVPREAAGPRESVGSREMHPQAPAPLPPGVPVSRELPAPQEVAPFRAASGPVRYPYSREAQIHRAPGAVGPSGPPRQEASAGDAAARDSSEAGEPPLREAHTAPHDEILEVFRRLFAHSHGRGVTIDALSLALKGRGFRRTPGSPRLITRLRRIKEMDITRSGLIRPAGVGGGSGTAGSGGNGGTGGAHAGGGSGGGGGTVFAPGHAPSPAGAHPAPHAAGHAHGAGTGHEAGHGDLPEAGRAARPEPAGGEEGPELPSKEPGAGEAWLEDAPEANESLPPGGAPEEPAGEATGTARRRRRRRGGRRRSSWGGPPSPAAQG
ncbi:MAG: hypothetical protein HYZ53_24825 [Planctomycetes bacterium]|nr:hypothetical protein [Planctomycetota bacterium]